MLELFQSSWKDEFSLSVLHQLVVVLVEVAAVVNVVEVMKVVIVSRIHNIFPSLQQAYNTIISKKRPKQDYQTFK